MTAYNERTDDAIVRTPAIADALGALQTFVDDLNAADFIRPADLITLGARVAALTRAVAQAATPPRVCYVCGRPIDAGSWIGDGPIGNGPRAVRHYPNCLVGIGAAVTSTPEAPEPEAAP